jgi:hypothetical protein
MDVAAAWLGAVTTNVTSIFAPRSWRRRALLSATSAMATLSSVTPATFATAFLNLVRSAGVKVSMEYGNVTASVLFVGAQPPAPQPLLSPSPTVEGVGEGEGAGEGEGEGEGEGRELSSSGSTEELFEAVVLPAAPSSFEAVVLPAAPSSFEAVVLPAAPSSFEAVVLLAARRSG